MADLSADIAIRSATVVTAVGESMETLRNVDVVIDGDRILHAGPQWAGTAQREIDGAGLIVMPGFVSTHAHVADHLGDRLILDGGRREFLRTGFLNYVPRRNAKAPGFSAARDPAAALRYGFALLARNGVTTVTQFEGGPDEDDHRALVEAADQSGLRVFAGCYANGGEYFFDPTGRLKTQRDEVDAMRQIDKAAEWITTHDGACGGRFTPMLMFDELIFASGAILCKLARTAQELDVLVSLHASEQLFEFHEILRRTGMTPVRFMAANGILGPKAILAHCLYIGGHSETGYPFDGDIELLVEHGATVAHAPLALSRRSKSLQSLRRYLDAGVRVAMGTDSFPLDMFEEMRWAREINAIVDPDGRPVTAGEVLMAATRTGALALGRPDLGVVEAGAASDLLILDPALDGYADPADAVSFVVNFGSPAMIRDVLVNGRPVVRDRQLLSFDEAACLREVQDGARKVWAAVPDWHFASQPVDAVFPPSLMPMVPKDDGPAVSPQET